MKSTTLVLFLLASAAAGRLFEDRDTQTVRYPGSRVRLVDCGLYRGRVAFTGTADTIVAVTAIAVGRGRELRHASAALANITVTMADDDGVLRLSSQHLAQAWGEVRFDITGPAGMPLELRAGLGGASVTGTTGAASVTVDSGDITTAATSGPLALTTVDGGIAVNGHRGPLEVLSSGGPVELTLDEVGPGDTVTVIANRDVTLSLPDTVRTYLECRTNAGAITCTGLVIDVEENTNTSLVARVVREDGYITVTALEDADIAVIGRP